jgi:hypothetical protein
LYAQKGQFGKDKITVAHKPLYSHLLEPSSPACYTATQGEGQRGRADNRMNIYRGKVNAPEFPVGLDWLNVATPLTLAGLRGKVVLLEFWTSG